MPHDRELLARRKMLRETTEPAPDPTAALRQARAARAAETPRPWAQAFFEGAAHSGLPLATLNDIVAESASLEAANDAMVRRVAAGQGSQALRPAAKADAASRISAAHAKAHQPRRGPSRH